jgi:hypothetical protein
MILPLHKKAAGSVFHETAAFLFVSGLKDDPNG